MRFHQWSVKKRMQVTATQLSQYVELKVLLGDAIPTYNYYLLLLLLFLKT